MKSGGRVSAISRSSISPVGAWELGSLGAKWNVGPGTIFAYGPGVAYSLKALSESGLTKYFVDLAGRSAARLIARTGLKGATPGRIMHRRWLHDILEQLIETTHLRPSVRKTISTMLAGPVFGTAAGGSPNRAALFPRASGATSIAAGISRITICEFAACQMRRGHAESPPPIFPVCSTASILNRQKHFCCA